MLPNPALESEVLIPQYPITHTALRSLQLVSRQHSELSVNTPHSSNDIHTVQYTTTIMVRQAYISNSGGWVPHL